MTIFKKRGSYILMTLSLLFALGAAIRFVPSNTAVADTALPSQPIPTESSVVDATSSSVSPDAVFDPIDEVCFTDRTARDLASDMADLKRQLSDLDDRELSIMSREAQLSLRSAELEALRLTLDERWAEMQTASEEDILHLARMYGSMKPDQAAAIFNQMVPEFAGGFLRRMRSEQAGLIMANMEPRKAYAVSVQLASVNEDIRQASVSEN